MNINTAMLVPLAPVIVFAALLVVWCLVDIARRPAVKQLPKWAWALIVLLVTPLGAVLYLVVGRESSRVHHEEDLR